MEKTFRTWIDELARKNKRATVKHYANIVADFLEFKGIDARKHAEKFHVGKRETQRAMEKRNALALSDEELRRFLSAQIDPPRSVRLKFPPEFYVMRNNLIRHALYYTGMRVHELSNVKMEWLKGDYIYIPTEFNKNKKPRVVPIKGIRKYIDRYLDIRKTLSDSPYLLLNNSGGRLTEQGIRLVVNEIFKKAGIKTEGRSCHKLRHRRITELVTDIPPAIVAEVMGNSVRTIEKVYFNPKPDDILKHF